MKIRIVLFTIAIALSIGGYAQVEHVNGQTKLINPTTQNSGRTLLIERDDADSWLTFHDPNNRWFSFGIDKSTGVLSLNSGGTLNSTQFVMTPSGNVGIGTSQASDLLHLKGINPSLRLSSSIYYGGSGGAQNSVLSTIKFVNRDLNYNYRAEIRGLLTGGWANQVGLSFTTHYQGSQIERMRIVHNGNVGIGTTNPAGWKLAVNGKIRAKEIKVETGWGDFVFENTYALPTLREVEQHIKEKGHLKDIPSAEEVAKNGILLGEMNAKLLVKIEELTLYMIAQEKRIEKLENQNKQVGK